MSKSNSSDVAAMAALLSTLAGLTNPASPNAAHKDMALQFHDDPTIIIPKGMSPEQAQQWLASHQKHWLQKINLRSDFRDRLPMDVLSAIPRALKTAFGFVSWQNGAWGQPPVQISIQTGPSTSESVPYGTFKLPGFTENSSVSIQLDFPDRKVPHVYLSATCQRNEEPLFNQLVTAINTELSKMSLYRGKAWTFSNQYLRDARDYDIISDAPTFFSAPAAPPVLAFNDAVQAQLESMLYLPIAHPAAIKALGLDPKRGAVLAGDYGTGKTEAIYECVRRALLNNRTVIKVNDPRDLTAALKVAVLYAPALIVMEDLDRVITGTSDTERTIAIDDFLNTLDGPELKRQDVVVVATTNNVSAIHPAALRPGRMNPIEITLPNAETASRLISMYGGALLSHGFNLTDAGVLLAGQKPAIIADVVQRSKLTAFARMYREDPTVEATTLRITNGDMEATYASMQFQRNLLAPKPTEEKEVRARAATILGSSIERGIERAASSLATAMTATTNG